MRSENGAAEGRLVMEQEISVSVDAVVHPAGGAGLIGPVPSGRDVLVPGMWVRVMQGRAAVITSIYQFPDQDLVIRLMTRSGTSFTLTADDPLRVLSPMLPEDGQWPRMADWCGYRVGSRVEHRLVDPAVWTPCRVVGMHLSQLGHLMLNLDNLETELVDSPYVRLAADEPDTDFPRQCGAVASAPNRGQMNKSDRKDTQE